MAQHNRVTELTGINRRSWYERWIEEIVTPSQGIDLALEPFQATDGSRECRQAINIINDVADGKENLGKSNAGLTKYTKIDLLGKVDWSNNQPWKKT